MAARPIAIAMTAALLCTSAVTAAPAMTPHSRLCCAWSTNQANRPRDCKRRPDGLHDLDAEQHEREAADRKRPVADAAQPAAPADGGGRAGCRRLRMRGGSSTGAALRQRPGKPARQPDGGAREQHRHADASEAEPDQLGGEARADVRAENDAERSREGQYASADEADGDYGNGGAALERRREYSAGGEAAYRRAGKPLQPQLEAGACPLLKRGFHQLHTE